MLVDFDGIRRIIWEPDGGRVDPGGATRAGAPAVPVGETLVLLALDQADIAVRNTDATHGEPIFFAVVKVTGSSGQAAPLSCPNRPLRPRGCVVAPETGTRDRQGGLRL